MNISTPTPADLDSLEPAQLHARRQELIEKKPSSPEEEMAVCGELAKIYQVLRRKVGATTPTSARKRSSSAPPLALGDVL